MSREPGEAGPAGPSMVQRARHPTFDAAAGTVHVRVSVWHLKILVGAKLLDAATTALALTLAADGLAEAQPITAVLIARLGVLEGTLLVGGLAVVAITALAELAGAVLATAQRRLQVGPAGLPRDATAFIYYFGAAWFALLAVSNGWVLLEAVGL